MNSVVSVFIHTVQLWSVNNYHWYLKQELAFPASLGDQVACVAWDPEAPLRLHIMCEGQSLFIDDKKDAPIFRFTEQSVVKRHCYENPMFLWGFYTQMGKHDIHMQN